MSNTCFGEKTFREDSPLVTGLFHIINKRALIVEV